MNFEDYILREKESSNRATNLILVVIIPLVLNFLYTVWKDFKKGKMIKKRQHLTAAHSACRKIVLLMKRNCKDEDSTNQVT